MSLAEWQGECRISKRVHALTAVRDLFDRGLFGWREIGGKLYIHVERYEQNQDRFKKRRRSKNGVSGGALGRPGGPELSTSCAGVEPELSGVEHELSERVVDSEVVTDEKSRFYPNEQRSVERSTNEKNVTVPRARGPAPPPDAPNGGTLDRRTERNTLALSQDSPVGTGEPCPVRARVPANGTEHLGCSADVGPSKAGGGAGPRARGTAGNGETGEAQVKFVAGILAMLRAAGANDDHSRKWWEAVVRSYFGDGDPRALESLREMCRGLRLMLESGTFQGDPRAWLTRAVKTRANDLGFQIK